ncbi:hypothetical protein [Flavobacterium sp. KMS]|jgi:hypothetical protein|uniref:hypothetical protein n=1 Tax=unclassified Flavobacterium TaxID=196869 RepID=UPI00057CC136|nr:hypothetical protein [Flavobacterium sp. KMS]KIA97079.1 hypothetical protein OA93_15965 [Flavobacterium sp. KMS]
MKLEIKLCLLFILLTCITCDGTLGGFSTIRFPTSKAKIKIAIDSLYSKYPEYKIPSKWDDNDNWSKRGYDFLESHIFYFKDTPEEMYYISFIGDEETFKDTTHIDIAIRSVFTNRNQKWLKQEEFGKDEENRIQTRFKNEIVSKLEKYTNTKSKDLEN